jgi:hypothetical protein
LYQRLIFEEKLLEQNIMTSTCFFELDTDETESFDDAEICTTKFPYFSNVHIHFHMHRYMYYVRSANNDSYLLGDAHLHPYLGMESNFANT